MRLSRSIPGIASNKIEVCQGQQCPEFGLEVVV